MRLTQVLIAPLFLVLVGVLMTVTSAIVSHYFITQYNNQITDIHGEIAHIEVRIEKQWQETQRLERREDFSIVLMLLSNKGTAKNTEIPVEVLRHFRDTLESAGVMIEGNKDHGTWLEVISKAIASHKKKTIDSINDLYLDVIMFKAEARVLNKRNMSLTSIALFLQIMGLILVLSHDIWRK